MLPNSDVFQIINNKPSLLLIDDIPQVMGSALQKLKALMPGIPVEDKLHQGGTVWWSFVSLLPSLDHNTYRSRAWGYPTDYQPPTLL